MKAAAENTQKKKRERKRERKKEKKERLSGARPPRRAMNLTLESVMIL
jgi:hypothetical protein